MEPVNQQKESVLSKQSMTVEKYKKRLLTQVVIIFVICLFLILQRVFYQIIVDAQQSTIASLQLSTDMTRKKGSTVLPDEITNHFLQFFNTISKFPFKFLFMTHILCTLYVSFDSFLASKLLYTMMIIIYVVSVIQIFYAGPRPFWSSDSILTSSCLPSYSHPHMGLILMLFLPFYGYYSWKKKLNNISLKGSKTKHIFLGVSVFVITAFIQFVNYFTGTVYLINIATGVIIGTLLFMVAISGQSLFEKSIKQATILKTNAKKFVFSWVLFISLLCTVILILFSAQNLFLDIQWVENYMHCLRYLKYPNSVLKYDEVIGPWFNLLQCASLFGWMGAVFGISYCFRKIDNIEWAKGPTKDRIVRAIIGNLFIIPSWLFIVFLEYKGTWIRDIGLNEFIIDSLHFFCLYFWLFGYMPVLVFKKFLQNTSKEEEDFYVILEEK